MTTKQNILRVLISRKAEFSMFGIRNIGLFGSYIRNEQIPGSDIDLLLDFEPESESFDNFMAVYDLMEQLFKGRKLRL